MLMKFCQRKSECYGEENLLPFWCNISVCLIFYDDISAPILSQRSLHIKLCKDNSLCKDKSFYHYVFFPVFKYSKQYTLSTDFDTLNSCFQLQQLFSHK